MADKSEPTFNLLADKIRARRQDLRITSGSELGRRAGIDQSLVSRIESGKRLPSRDDLTKIAAALDLPAGELQVLSDLDDLGLDRVQKLVEYATGVGIGARVVAIMEAAKRLSPFYQDVALAILESGLPDAPWRSDLPRENTDLAERLFERADELKNQAYRLEVEARGLLDETLGEEEVAGALREFENRRQGRVRPKSS
jgi:transcriptional regulator with XRE-family HTH domain